MQDALKLHDDDTVITQENKDMPDPFNDLEDKSDKAIDWEAGKVIDEINKNPDKIKQTFDKLQNIMDNFSKLTFEQQKVISDIINSMNEACKNYIDFQKGFDNMLSMYKDDPEKADQTATDIISDTSEITKLNTILQDIKNIPPKDLEELIGPILNEIEEAITNANILPDTKWE